MSELAWEKEQLELRILEVDLETKKLELSNKKSWRRSVNPTAIATIIAVLIAFLGNLLIEHGRHVKTSVLEQKKTEANLVIEAAKSGDPDVAKARLNFFQEVGLIEDEKILAFIKGDKVEGLFTPILMSVPTYSGFAPIFYQPLLISSFVASDDGKEYTFEIKNGFETVDGKQVDAPLLVSILEKNKAKLDNYKRSEIVSKMKFKVYLSKVDPRFLEKLSKIGVNTKKKSTEQKININD